MITAGEGADANNHFKNVKNGQKSVKGSKFGILSIIFGTKSGYYIPILHTFYLKEAKRGHEKTHTHPTEKHTHTHTHTSRDQILLTRIPSYQ